MNIYAVDEVSCVCVCECVKSGRSVRFHIHLKPKVTSVVGKWAGGGAGRKEVMDGVNGMGVIMGVGQAGDETSH